VEPTGDIVTPLVAVARRPAVVVAAVGWGTPPPTSAGSPKPRPVRRERRSRRTRCLPRRSDAPARGPIDEHFRFYRNLDIWWSLVLRDEGEGTPAATRGRRSPSPATPATSTAAGPTTAGGRAATGLSKRNFYRIIDRFGAASRPRTATADQRSRDGLAVVPSVTVVALGGQISLEAGHAVT
jgi:hypothetical protein